MLGRQGRWVAAVSVLGLVACGKDDGSGAASAPAPIRDVVVETLGLSVTTRGGPLGIGQTRGFTSSAPATWRVLGDDAGVIDDTGTYTAPTRAGTFTIRAARLDARDVTADVLVEVEVAPSAPACETATALTEGETGTARVEPDTAARHGWAVQGATELGRDSTGETFAFGPSTSEVTLECWSINRAGLESERVTQKVKIVPAPRIQSFTVSDTAPNPGVDVTLTATFEGGIGRVEPGGVVVTSGTPFTMPAPTSGRITLTVTNDLGRVTTADAPLEARRTGELALSLPGGPASARVRLSAPGEVPIDVAAGTTTLPVGRYTMTADPIVVGGRRYAPSLATADVTVAAGASVDLAVTYAAVDLLPEIGPIADLTMLRTDSAFTMTAPITSGNDVRPLLFSFVSDDPAIVDPAAITTGGNGAQLAITLRPGAKLGSTTVTARATDAAGRVGVRSFRVTVGNRPVVAMTDDGPGSLREAIATSAPGDVIVFDRTTDGGFVALQSRIEVTVPVTVVGLGPGRTTITGASRTSLFRSAAAMKLESLTLADGVGDTSGGIYATAGILELDRVVAERLTGRASSALLANDLVVMRDSTIQDTSGLQGTVVLKALSSKGTSTIERSTFTRNELRSSGGVVSSDGKLVLDNDTFVANVNLASATATIVSKMAPGSLDPVLTMRHVTVSGNGGGAGSRPQTAGVWIAGTATLQGSIVTGNDPRLDSPNLLVSGTGTLSQVGPNLVDAGDPALDVLSVSGGFTRTACPLPQSAARGGLPLAFVALRADQRGLPRPGPGKAAADLGACEVQP